MSYICYCLNIKYYIHNLLYPLTPKYDTIYDNYMSFIVFCWLCWIFSMLAIMFIKCYYILKGSNVYHIVNLIGNTIMEYYCSTHICCRLSTSSTLILLCPLVPRYDTAPVNFGGLQHPVGYADARFYAYVTPIT